MKKQRPSAKDKQLRTVIKTYWIHIIFIFFLANFAITRTLQLKFMAQSCMTKAMIESDQRCLYIYANNVYEKGSRNNPHHGNACGSDVTNILPSFHLADMVRYMDPNLIAPYCGNVVPTNTPVPSPTPSPIPTATPQPTSVPPTNTPQPTQQTTVPTNTPQPTQRSQNPTATQKTSPSNTPLPTATTTPTPTTPVTIIENSAGNGFGKFLAVGSTQTTGNNSQSSVDLGILNPPSKPEVARFWTSIIFWSELLTAGSFLLLVVSLVVSGAKYIAKPRHA